MLSCSCTRIDDKEFFPGWSLPALHNFIILYYMPPSVITSQSMSFSVLFCVLFLIIFCVGFLWFFNHNSSPCQCFQGIFYLSVRSLESWSWTVVSDKIAQLYITIFSSLSLLYISLCWVLMSSHSAWRGPYAVLHCWPSIFLAWITQYSQQTLSLHRSPSVSQHLRIC